MPDGGILFVSVKRKTITNSTGLMIPEGMYVEKIIKDTGTGIKKENLKKIFKPFFSTKDDGCGIGRALTELIINQHHGIITVDSIVNQGTIFTIYLPL